ncbi:MAG TPA: hypothetical protein VKS60_03995, partial [Stellaceae bacterium]|nr:hypothetical protein [Stellaceae bacterium]
MSDNTYSLSYDYSITLNASYGASFTFTSTATVAPPSGDGIIGSGSIAFTVYNYGEVAALGGTGITLSDGGTVENLGTGKIDAANGIEIKGAPGSINNMGSVYAEGSGGVGLFLYEGGTITNSGDVQAAGGEGIGVRLGGLNSYLSNAHDGYIAGYIGVDATFINCSVYNDGTIAGGAVGIQGATSIYNTGVVEVSASAASGILGAGYLFNDGTIDAYGASGTAVYEAGTVFNSNGGTIEGASGISFANVVRNAGSISATSGMGIYLEAGGTITNYSGASILGNDGIFISHHAATVYNFGVIGGGGNGIEIYNTGTVTNASNGLIYGSTGIFGGGYDALVRNYGTISGTKYSVYFGNHTDTLAIEAGSELIGLAKGGDGLLRLAAATGTITDLGATTTISGGGTGSFTGFGTYLVSGIGSWTLEGGGTLSAAQELAVHGTLTVDAQTLSIAGSVSDTGTIALSDGLLTIQAGLSGNGTIELSNGATLDLGGPATGTIAFLDATEHLVLGDPAGVSLTVDGFVVGDTIDLPTLHYGALDSVSYADGVATIERSGTIVAEITLSGLPSGAVLGLVSDGAGGTELILEQSSNNQNLVSDISADQQPLLSAALEALDNDVATAGRVASAPLNVFTPPSLVPPPGAAAGSPVLGDVNIANGAPTAPGEIVDLGPQVQGVVLTGSTDALLRGFTTTELLVGNLGNDTIRGAGGSGTIISGSGTNQIHTGAGDMVVSSGGTDRITTGGGADRVDAYGSATVIAGAGLTVFTDDGTAAGSDRVRGGTGTTVMNSGLGQDTFIGGSGASFMNDTGGGNVAFEFIRGLGGFDFVSGFDAATDYIRTAGNSYGWSDFQTRETVVGGSTFVDLGTTR